MKIGILGTRGIPNYHGGFEQFAEFFATFLVQAGHEVFVYCSHTHPYKEAEFQGVSLIHCKDPEHRMGTAGQFIYDYNCIMDSRKRDFDVLLQLGYTSNSIWYWLLPRKPVILTNMDGLEWKRSKYSVYVRRFLKRAEAWAVKSSDYLIADSKGIQTYLKEAYGAPSEYIPYGADVFKDPKPKILQQYQLEPFSYHMLIARMEPENSIEVILDGVVKSGQHLPFLVVGKYDTNQFGKFLKEKYASHEHIRFLGGIYDMEHLNNLRYYSKLYFHGHTVGGTNPSLLEAMACDALIIAHDNPFNKSILLTNGLYFNDSAEVTNYLLQIKDKEDHRKHLDANIERIKHTFSWEAVNNAYLRFIKETYGQSTHVS